MHAIFYWVMPAYMASAVWHCVMGCLPNFLLMFNVLEEALLWIVESYFLARSNGLNLKHLNDRFVSYKHGAVHFIQH